MSRGGISTRIGMAAACAALLALGPVAQAQGQTGGYGSSSGIDFNPCLTEMRQQLLCPDLRMKPPSDMFVLRRGGKVRLQATNNLRSRGVGPMELLGKRIGPKTMDATQRIHRRGGGKLLVPTPAVLRFYYVPGQGPYWKLHMAAKFELWSLRPSGRRNKLVRVGPKLNYCLRDLERTKPGPLSPPRRVYPACSQDPDRQRVVLGTSVGWSDIYPSTYEKQWINVAGLTGCFLFIHRADPLNNLAELNERNNVGAVRVKLPIRDRIRGCQP